MMQTATFPHPRPDAAAIDFEAVAQQFFEPLYRFAFSLTHNADDAGDLAQETFRTFLLKAEQIRQPAKVRHWLFTTLYRRFLQGSRRSNRFPTCELEELSESAASVSADQVDRIDARAAWACLERLEARYREPLMLFYLEDQSYREIAATLHLPVGTVMSRLSRGKLLLRQELGACF